MVDQKASVNTSAVIKDQGRGVVPATQQKNR
jgi:hypothetical protein